MPRVKLCWSINQPFKYRCLIKVHSCELGFLLHYVRALESGDRHNQTSGGSLSNFCIPEVLWLYWPKTFIPADGHLILTSLYLVNCSTSQLEVWGEHFLGHSCSTHFKKDIFCQISLAWTGLGRNQVGTRSYNRLLKVKPLPINKDRLRLVLENNI
jgi:hypothetical protein